MSQKVKVQGGVVHYGAADPEQPVDFSILGQANVRDILNVGSEAATDALITTNNGSIAQRVDLGITTGEYGTVNIFQNAQEGAILINNAQWPDGTVTPTQGMFLGSPETNVLQYYSFFFDFTTNDAMTTADLNSNTAYQTIQPGQSIVGTTVIYLCVSKATDNPLDPPESWTYTMQWRKIGAVIP